MIHRIETITLSAIIACYGLWAIALFLSLWAAMPALAVLIAFQSSLQHEIIHNHPTPWRWLNEALGYPSLNLFIPYARFRDTHLAHHINTHLTDPYDDPESNYLSYDGWAALCRVRRPILRANGTLLGRMVFGPAISQVYFMIGDIRAIRDGNMRILRQWAVHLVITAAILWGVSVSATPIWAYLIAAYFGLSILKIRTFAEHQAHEKIGARSVIIEDRGPLAFLFLNNNYHALHHMHPAVPWYALPDLYAARKERVLRRNQNYRFAGYGALLRQYFLRAKDPVIHPDYPAPKGSDRQA